MKPPQNLFNRLCHPDELAKAWADVKRHYRQGREPQPIQDFDRERDARLESLSRELRSKQFIPTPAALVYIPKPGKPHEKREISLTGPEDRIVLTALNRILNPIFERQFSPRSYAYRPGRGAFGAIEHVTRALRDGLQQIAAADIDNFFSNIRRDQLLDAIRKTVWEQNLIDLLETYLHIGSALGTLEWVDSGVGVTQGSPLSPLLSNVYLHPFDEFLAKLPGVPVTIRYADNFILLARDADAAAKGLQCAEAFLADHCGMTVNADSRVHASAAAQGFEFLGFQFHGGRRTMTVDRLNRKKQGLSELFRNHKGSLERLIEELSDSAKGWRQYYGAVSDTSEQLQMLEQHIFDVFVPWLQALRTEKAKQPGPKPKMGDLKAELLEIELPFTKDPRQKLKWVELLLARSKPVEAADPAAPRVSEQARRAIERRRREIRKKRDELQELIISKPGAYLGRTGERLLIRRDGKKQHEIPLSAVRNISWLTTAGSMSTDLMVAAAARGISIHILGRDGKPEVRIGPVDSPSFHLSAAQSKMASTTDGLKLATSIIQGKIRNQGNVLRYFGKYRGRRKQERVETEMGRTLLDMEEAERQLDVLFDGGETDLELLRGRIFSIEGRAAGGYWRVVKTLIWQNVGFAGRVRQGATDPLNSALNYGYGILYSRLSGVLARTGLNLSIGFLHKPRAGKPALLFDFIEEFRAAAVDRAVLSLLNLGKEVTLEKDGRLDADSRHALAEAVTRRLQSPVRYRSAPEPMALQDAIVEQSRLLVRHIEGKEEYKPWILQW